MSEARKKYYRLKSHIEKYHEGITKEITDYVIELERLTICTGCGHLSWDEIKPPARACCPDDSYIPVRDFIRKMWYENIALATDKRMLGQQNATLKLEQEQCLICTAKHKEEVLELKQQTAELMEALQSAVDGYACFTEWTMLLNKYKHRTSEEENK